MSVALVLSACTAPATRGDVVGSGLLGVWRLSTWKGQSVREIPNPDPEYPADPAANDLTFKLQKDQLVFSGKTGMAFIEELQKDGNEVRMKAYYDGTPYGGTMQRSIFVVHFADVDTIYLVQEPSNEQENIAVFFWPGPDAQYTRLGP